ncbi:MAG: CopD family protein [Pseudomonadota bacterium]
MQALAIALHVLAVVIWVGGMFFAYMFTRPAAVESLEAPERLKLWNGIFRRFFPWVWLAIAVILATGYWYIFSVLGGMDSARLHIHTMNGLGFLMMAIFLHVFFAPYGRLKKAVAAGDWQEGGRNLGQIRWLVGLNTLIGLVTIVVGAGGQYF